MTANRQAWSSFRTLRDGGHDVVLWLAGSQSYTIVDFQRGDRMAVEVATQAAERRGASVRYLQCSSGLMNLNEMFYVFAGFIERGMIPKAVVIGLVYNDLDSHTGIRPDLLRNLPVDVTPEMRMLDFRQCRGDRAGLCRGPLRHAPASPASMTRPFPPTRIFTRIEKALTGGLEELWPAYAYRRQAQAWLRYQANELAKRSGRLVVTAHVRTFRLLERRPVLDGTTYRWNRSALQSILALARAHGVRVLMYRVPNPPQVPAVAGVFPYDQGEFDRTSADIRGAVAAVEGNAFRDLHDLVPWPAWEPSLTKGEGLDFMHFTGEGHRLLGTAVDAFVRELL